MNLSVHGGADAANRAASSLLAGWLVEPGVTTLMLAAGNTPLELYRLIGEKGLSLGHLSLFALDEYVGVPEDEPRNCAQLIRRTAVEPWGVSRYFAVSSDPDKALASVEEHERRIEAMGGLDVLVLGLGQNGHLGFNEPGSAEHSTARVLDLDPISVEANRKWFGGDYAPHQGVTVGMRTILGARRILILAYGAHKADAVREMLRGPRTEACPACFLRGHPEVHLFVDEAAASGLADQGTAATQRGS